MSDLATVCIPGTRAYRAGVTRGYARADRMYQMDGVAVIPLREDIRLGMPYWANDFGEELEDYLSGFAVGFANRVQGCWPNGMQRKAQDG